MASASTLAFQSLVNRSVTAWLSLNYVGVEKDASFDKHISVLQDMNSLQALLECREY